MSHDSLGRPCLEGYPTQEIDLAHIQCISGLARYIGERAITYESPTTSLPPDDLSDSHIGEGDEFRLLSIEEMSQIGSSHISASEVTLWDLFSHDYRTMVYGDSNVGKSFFMQQVALAFATGSSCFCFSKHTPAKVAYIDGEMGDSFLPRLRMLNGGHLSTLARNLKIMPLRGSSLGDIKVQKSFIQKLQEFNPDLVIIDNIIALINEAVRGNVESLLSLVKKMEKNGSAVVLVHHTCKNVDTYKGPSELAALCQNVIHLRGRTQIQDEFSDQGCSVPPRVAVLISSNDIGPVISMSFEKCKICPELEKSKHFYFLPINGQWMPLDSKGGTSFVNGVKNNDFTAILGNVESPKSNAIPSASSVTTDSSREEDQVLTDTLLGDFTGDELLILEEAKKSRITNTSVRTILNCSESKASVLLKSLVESNFLRKIGAGRSTEYTLVNELVPLN